MSRSIRVLVAFAVIGVTAFAQREFLTNDEIEKIREAQEPNLRLTTYIQFAKQRMDQINQQIAKDRKGRSVLVRQLLEDYTQIIDAIDTVSDDALKRGRNIDEGLVAVASAEKKFLEQLKKIEAGQPHDLDMYEINLKDALDTTAESIETAAADTGKRTEAVRAKDAADKKKLESLTSTEQVKEQKAEAAKAELGADGKPKRKPPTLYRPGEKPEATKP
jgi:hypothetical protein